MAAGWIFDIFCVFEVRKSDDVFAKGFCKNEKRNSICHPLASARALELGRRTLVMGIVNVTPDSFSDGGRFFNPEAAVRHALELLDEDADLLDLGAESTRPGTLYALLQVLSVTLFEKRPISQALQKKDNTNQLTGGCNQLILFCF
jgi:hypothetical protein